MPRRLLPPLRALTAFEAAARLGSFRMAADELGITRSAVSHQIRVLEETLGLELFHRDARRALLSKAGHLYYPPVRDAFDQIQTQTRLLRPGTVVLIPPDAPHAGKALTGCRIVDAFYPTREDWR